ncbi:class I tRNA ligase family protein [Actinokineospora cianjurensis]|uniref:class I tRNA ligase family protein n=1 Tax=Actinokineospora cianjurensis TaxID=585224 RepID=UPI001FE62AF5|nr:class I tRNA ligase family protein [Actinokineospora cianjurensis]
MGVVERVGVDALRWWLVREVPRTGDVDFTVERLVGRYHEDLANGLGNLVNRTVSMIRLVADELTPFLPEAARRIATQVTVVGGALPAPLPLFPRFED